jgi:hypothetical protein
MNRMLQQSVTVAGVARRTIKPSVAATAADARPRARAESSFAAAAASITARPFRATTSSRWLCNREQTRQPKEADQ